jgi:uncharacterized protein YggE
MDTKPDTIKISASHREELPASHADLFVSVRGSSVISGDQALKKAKEVSQLVDELTRFGLPAANIHLEGIHVEASSAGLLRSSSASYRLRLRCENLDEVPDLLDIISTQKNAALERIAWKYPDEAAREGGLETAIASAKLKAGKVAAALGVRLLGVYDFIENYIDEETPLMFQAQASLKARGPAPASEPALSMDIRHAKTIHINVDIWYRVSEFEGREGGSA